MRKAFASGPGQQAECRRPFLIALIAALQMVGAPFCLAAVFVPIPALCLGFILYGWPRATLFLMLGAAQIAGAAGLWCLKEWGRRLMMAFLAYGIVNSAIAAARPSLMSRYNAATNRIMNLPAQAQFASHFEKITGIGMICVSTLMLLAIFWVLHRYRARFLPPADGLASAEPLEPA